MLLSTCSCGHTYTLQQFRCLAYVGIQCQEDLTGAPDLELRNCECGSTITWDMPRRNWRRLERKRTVAFYRWRAWGNPKDLSWLCGWDKALHYAEFGVRA